MKKSKKLLSALLALVMVLTAFPVMALATDESGVKPSDGMTENQPFVANQPSQNYRIPGIVTLDDGTLVAVADTRWNRQMDGGGNDVIVTRSTNNGKTWSYHMLNYFPDNGNNFNTGSTSFCDSEIATDGRKVYVLSTFFPAGIAINASSANERPWQERAFHESGAYEGKLKLRLNAASTYDYYLDTSTKMNGRYTIRSTSTNVADSTWTVDENFFLYEGNNKNGSIFYSDGHYVTCRTTFLWFRSSDDGGVSWNAPKLLDLQRSDESFLGVGPGRGLVTSTGDIVFATYKYSSNSGAQGQRTYLVSSSDGGETWKRTSGDATNGDWWSSEAAPVELPNGDIRVFLRSEGKVLVKSDARRNADGTYTWLNNKGTVNESDGSTTIPIWSDCQQSAVMYPYKIDGKNAVIVSCPTNTSSARKNGTLHLILLDENNNTARRYTKAITGVNESYEYSSMDVLDNGNIALLYESNSNNSYSIRYQEVDIHDIATGATIDIPQVKNITLEAGETYNFVADTNSISSYDNNVVSVTNEAFNAAKVQLGTNSSYGGNKVSSSNALYRFTTSGSGYTMKNNYSASTYVNINANDAGYPQSTSGEEIRVDQASGNEMSNLYIRSASGPYLMFWKGDSSKYNFDRWGGALNDNANAALGGTIRNGAEANLFRPVQYGETSSTEIPGYVKIARAADVKADTDYLIAYKGTNGTYYVMYPSTSTSDKFSHVAKVLPTETEAAGYNVKITALNDGVTQFKVGDVTYNVTVSSTVAVTGAVKYDPVIYTQGSDFTSFGTRIAEGATTAERKTAYQVAPGYSINYIEATEGVVDSGTSISAENGILKGTVQLTGGNNSKTLNEKIKIKTFLTGPGGKQYTQENYLYVATSPVPAHIVSLTNSYYTDTFDGEQWITVAPMGLIAKGSTSAYDSTNYTTSPSSTDQSKYANSISLYGEDGMSLSSFASVTGGAHSPNTAVTFDGNKLGGWYGYHSGSVSSNGSGLDVTGEFTGTTGHYYYDKSSSYNPGFKTSNGNTAQIELVLNRPIISPANDWVHDDYGDTLDVNNFTVTVGTETKTLSENNSRPTVSGVSPAFELFRYTANNNGLQTFTVDVNTSTPGTINGNMFIKVSHARGTYSWWALNETTLPFQIHVVDKSTVRTAYNNALTNYGNTSWDVLVSSDYTTTSWDNYQDQMLLAEGYLNNYDYNQSIPTDLYNYGGELERCYKALQKHIDLVELEKQLELKKDLYGIDFPCKEDGHNIYTTETWNTFQTQYTIGSRYANETYPDYASRVRTPGYNPTGQEGPHSTSTTSDQYNINSAAIDISRYPIQALDPTAYEDAKEIVATLDLDAYKDTVANEITTKVTNGDADIYEPGQVNKIVRLPITSQQYVDSTYTSVLLTDMNVASENTLVSDGGANRKGELSTIIFQKNGVETASLTYGYGTYLAFTVIPPDDRDPSATQVPRSQKDNLVVNVTIDNITSKIPLDSNNMVKFVAQAKTITVNLVTPTTTPTVYVRDYFGTLLYTGSATEDQITMDNSNATVTVNGTAIKAKPSPAFTFKSWQLTNEADGTICVIQKGTRIGDTHHFEAIYGIITRYNTTTPVNSFDGYGIPYTVTPNSGVTPIAWKMAVTDDNGVTRNYLAAYESSFTRFAYNQHTVYTPITSENELGALADAYGKPVSYGTGFISGDNSDKFTLACSYSAAPGTTVTEAGVLYSTNGALKPATMTKGADGVSTKIQTRVSDFGTYTMTKINALTGTYLMRSYVSYTQVVEGKTVIRVSYGPVYQCVDGQISIVE